MGQDSKEGGVSAKAIPSLKPSEPLTHHEKLPEKELDVSEVIRRTKKQTDKRYYAEVTIQDHPVRGLLDSGAMCTIIGQELAKKIILPDMTSTPANIKLKTADGTYHRITEIYPLKFCYKGKSKIIPTVILPQLQQSAILGLDFWEEFEIVLTVNTVEIETYPDQNGTLSENHELTIQEAERLQEAIKTLPFTEKGKLGRTHLLQHEIDTGTTKPIRRKAYVTSPYLQLMIDQELDRMLELDVIEVANSPWNNPMVTARKPNGKLRYCIDARALNEVTVRDAYPLPNINRILPRLRKTTYLSSIDLSDAFWQVPLRKEDRCKTAFTVSGRGFYQFKVMPFGLVNSASTLCKLVDQVIGADLEPMVFKYLDDIIIATETLEEHLAMIKEVSERLRKAGLTVSIDKSKFCLKKLRYVGYLIDKDGVHADPEKIEAVSSYPTPTSVKEVRRLYGMASWYRRFIEGFATITAPITDLIRTKGPKKFEWTDAAQKAFEEIKERLTTAPVLTAPTFGDPWFLETDASDFGIGGVLKQVQNGEERVIAYFSKKLSKAEQKYTVTERECLAVIASVEKFRCYIEGAYFTVISDHASLTWLKNLKDPQGRLARWALRLQSHDYKILHRPGKLMLIPDALSRAVYLIDMSENAKQDNEYNELIEKVRKSPDEYPQFRIQNEILYRHCRNWDNTVSSRWKIYVPGFKRNEVLQECHDDLTAAHGGVFKTLHRVRTDYFWPSLKHDVIDYVKKCIICKLTKSTNKNQTAPMGLDRSPEKKFETLCIDFIGPFPMSSKSHRWLLVAIDNFTKFVTIMPMRTATAAKTIQLLDEQIFTKFGTPENIILDNGSQLKSKLFLDFAQKKKIRLNFTANYHPQANPTEAANKTIMNAVRAYIKDHKSHRKWDENVQQLACAMNSAVHTSTKMTPYAAVFGEEIALTGDAHRLRLTGDHHISENEKLQKIQDDIIIELDKAYENRRKRYNMRTRVIVYQPGDVVYKQNFKQSNKGKAYMAKLDHKYETAVIKERVGSNCYILSDANGKTIPGTFNVQNLKT